MNLII